MLSNKWHIFSKRKRIGLLALQIPANTPDTSQFGKCKMFVTFLLESLSLNFYSGNGGELCYLWEYSEGPGDVNNMYVVLGSGRRSDVKLKLLTRDTGVKGMLGII